MGGSPMFLLLKYEHTGGPPVPRDMNDTSEHSWFTGQIAAYIAGGLAREDRARFESHAKECETCAAELAAAQTLEEKMSSLFAASLPAKDFEDRLIARLRETAPRLRIHIHPSV